MVAGYLDCGLVPHCTKRPAHFFILYNLEENSLSLVLKPSDLAPQFKKAFNPKVWLEVDGLMSSSCRFGPK